MISIREFARRLGCSDTAVHKAIKSGRINKGYNPKTKKIDFEVAAEEFRNNTDAMRARVFNGDGFIPKSQYRSNKQKKELEELLAGKQELAPEADVLPAEGAKKHARPPVPHDESLNQARKAEAVYNAKLKQLKYEEQSGKLVNKQDVYKKLFDYAQSVRTELLTLPDRTIDNILACRTRNEAHSLLYKAIVKALESLSNPEQQVKL